MEQLDLATPITVAPVTYYKVERLDLDWTNANIGIVVCFAPSGRRQYFGYTGETATTFMKALNKMDLSTNSMHKRILQKLVADGFLSGTVSGSPD